MKKVYSLLIIGTFFFATTAQAQIAKGNFLIGGGLGFSYSNTNTSLEQSGIEEDLGETTTTAIDVIPKIGFFFADGLAGGVQFEITSLTTKTENEKNVASKFLAGPFLRYYYMLGETNKALLLEANFGIGRTSVGEGDNNVSTSLIGVGVGPGLSLFSNDFIGIEALAKYNWVKGITEINDTKNSETVSEIDLSLGLQIYFTRVKAAN